MAVTQTGKIYQTRINTVETTQYFCDVWNLLNRMKLAKKIELFGPARLSLEVQLFPPHGKRYDADNFLKVLIDSLKHGRLFDDDSQIDRLLVLKEKPEPPAGKVIVQLTEI